MKMKMVIDHHPRLLSLRSCPFLLSLVIGLLTLGGCSQGTPQNTPPATSSSVDGSKFLLTAEPSGGNDVIKAREAAKDGNEIVIIGRIGGSANPWVDGRAAFSIVDPSLKSCDEAGSHKCPKPWDFC
jgi:hypothetical protein